MSEICGCAHVSSVSAVHIREQGKMWPKLCYFHITHKTGKINLGCFTKHSHVFAMRRTILEGYGLIHASGGSLIYAEISTHGRFRF